MNMMTLCCTKTFSQIYLEGVQEIVGKAGLQAVINTANLQPLFLNSNQGGPVLENGLSFLQIGNIEEALELVYGLRGGNGISLRAGRASFKFVLHRYGRQIGLASLEFRLIPTSMRVKKGLDRLADLFSLECNSEFQIIESEEKWLWQAGFCPWSSAQKLKKRSSYFLQGFLQEYCQWVSGGKFYNVSSVDAPDDETDLCVIQIDKKPMG